MIIQILVLNHLPANGAMNDLLIHVDPAGWGPPLVVAFSALRKVAELSMIHYGLW